MIRLFMRDALIGLAARTFTLIRSLMESAKRYGDAVIPGYTHARLAMPSTWTLWALAQIEGLLESVRYSEAAFAMADRSPLGSGAGFGAPLALDRKFTAALLGFAAPQVNVLSTQASRGKDAAAFLSAASMYALDLSRMCADLIFYSDELSGFVKIPDEFTTGSSIMPQKRNPDLLEIIRAKSAEINGSLGHAVGSLHALGSGYHRDLQLLKKPCLAAAETLISAMSLCAQMIGSLELNVEKARASLISPLFATDHVYRRMAQGEPFREAYRNIAKLALEGADFTPDDPWESIKARTSLGAPGNPAMDVFETMIAERQNAWNERAARIEAALERLQEEK